jgi:hypothetical protein
MDSRRDTGVGNFTVGLLGGRENMKKFLIIGLVAFGAIWAYKTFIG